MVKRGILAYRGAMRRPAFLLTLSLVVLPLGCSNPDPGATDGSTDTGSSGPVDEDSGSSSSSTDTGSDCTPGAFGCTCDENDMCAPMLECEAGMCVFGNSCTPGASGCECNNGMCDAGLACTNNVCGPPPCEPGSLGCGCDAGACDMGLECIGGECWVLSPYPDCGWDAANGWNVCGSTIENPESPVMCPDRFVLEAGAPCPVGLDIVGCCDANGDNWWCEGGATTFDDCAGGGGTTDTGTDTGTDSGTDSGTSTDTGTSTT